MNKVKILLISLLLIAISLFLYYEFRLEYIEKEYRIMLINNGNTIINNYKKFTKIKNNLNKLPDFLRSINKIYKHVAAIVITDEKYDVKASSKNNSYIYSVEQYDAMLKDFAQQKFSLEEDGLAVMFYGEQKSINNKYYIFPKSVDKVKFLIAFPLVFTKKFITKVALEIILIVILIIIIMTVIFILQNKLREETAIPINLDANSQKIQREQNITSKDSSKIASTSLNSYVFDLFKQIYTKYTTETISLYIFNPPDTLSKTYELKGKSFIKIDSSSFDTINIENEIGNELRNASILIMEEGNKIILPLIYNNSLLGTIVLKRHSSFHGDEINDIKEKTVYILKHLSDYLVVNNVMLDEATGLFSKTYLHIKHNELLKKFHQKGNNFSICMLSLFHVSEKLSDANKASIIKIIASTIQDNSPDDNFLCLYDDYICILLPDCNSSKARELVYSFIQLIAKFRIKIDPQKAVIIQPKAGLVSTDHNSDNMIYEALKDLHTALQTT